MGGGGAHAAAALVPPPLALDGLAQPGSPPAQLPYVAATAMAVTEYVACGLNKAVPSPSLHRAAPADTDDTGGPVSRRPSVDEARVSTAQYSPRVGAAAAAALASASYPSAADEEGELYAEDHDCISIVFIDVVGALRALTPRCSLLPC